MLSGDDILRSRATCAQVLVADEVARYAVRLVDTSRPGRGPQLGLRREVGEVGRRPARVAGADPRRQGAGADARPPPRSVKDIQALAAPILRHRVIPNFYAEAEGITADGIVERLLEAVPLPASGL